MRKGLLLSIISIIFLSLILEVGIRFYDWTKGLTLATHNNLELLYIPNAYYNYGFRLSMDVAYNRKKRERMYINSLGFRGSEFSVLENSNLFDGQWDKFMINIVHPNDAGAEFLAKNIFRHIVAHEKQLLNFEK